MCFLLCSVLTTKPLPGPADCTESTCATPLRENELRRQKVDKKGLIYDDYWGGGRSRLPLRFYGCLSRERCRFGGVRSRWSCCHFSSSVSEKEEKCCSCEASVGGHPRGRCGQVELLWLCSGCGRHLPEDCIIVTVVPGEKWGGDRTEDHQNRLTTRTLSAAQWNG